MTDIKAESIALGALFQACTQIHRIANTGFSDDLACACLYRAILVTEPRVVEDIYDPKALNVGFCQLLESFDKADANKTADSIAITKMALKLMSLTRGIETWAKIFQRLSDDIDSIKNTILATTPDFLTASADVINNQDNIRLFGNLYQSLISPNFPKLMIFGEERFLRDTDNQEKIRALLLCGIRALILWRQMGGRRRFLIFRRKKILEYIKSLLHA